jgi:hypothetical protein
MLKYIYDKSDKGREEIATRKYHLPSKLRSLLVMIDGHRSLEVLMNSFGPLGLSPDNVAELLADGYIVLVDSGEPEPSAEPAPSASRAPVTARARMAARRDASARAHNGLLEQLELSPDELAGPATITPSGDSHATLVQAAALGASEAEHYQAVQEFYSQTIKSTLGLRGMMLQLKVDKCANLAELRDLRDAYLEAVMKSKGREMALSLSGRLDQLLEGETTS